VELRRAHLRRPVCPVIVPAASEKSSQFRRLFAARPLAAWKKEEVRRLIALFRRDDDDDDDDVEDGTEDRGAGRQRVRGPI